MYHSASFCKWKNFLPNSAPVFFCEEIKLPVMYNVKRLIIDSFVFCVISKVLFGKIVEFYKCMYASIVLCLKTAEKLNFFVMI